MKHRASDYDSRPFGRTVLLSLTLLIVAATTPLPAQQSRPTVPAAAREATFIENRGQWDPSAQFLVQTPGLDAWITADGVVYDVYRHESVGDEKGSIMGLAVGSGNEHPFSGTPSEGAFGPDQTAANRIGHVVRMQFEGARQTTRLVGVDRQPGVYNYFIGNDRSKWATDVRRYSAVRVENLYEGIDAVYYLDEGRPRYDLVVSPGADVGLIRMAFTGAEHLSVAGDGALEITTGMGVLRQQGLFAYQEIGGVKKQIACDFVAGIDGTVRFEVGEYDRSRALVVDPLVWSTFVGGSSEEYATGIALDGSGNVYVTGYTYSSNYPTTSGAYDESHDGSTDVFVTKLNSDGATLGYSTFIGGQGEDYAYEIKLDGSGNAFVTGVTGSTDFPATSGAYDVSHGGSYDGFVAKLSSEGSSLSYSTFIGGASNEGSYGLAVDGSGNAYITGLTGSSGFPTTTGVYDGSFNGAWDAFVTKLSSDGSSVIYSTLIGGASYDQGRGIVVGGDGDAYITGFTYSTNYPITSGAYDGSHSGTYDVFVTKVSYDGSELIYSTFIGGSDHDYASAIALDGTGNAYVTGRTLSTDYPATTDAYDESYGGSNDVFVTKVNADGSSLGYSTFIGGAGTDEAYGIVVDGSGDAYITGRTGSNSFPTTSNAYDVSPNGNYDAFVTKVNSGGSSLAYSTFIGGSNVDVGNSVTLDRSGSAYVTGYTISANFPITTGAYDNSHNGSADIFITKLTTGGTITLTSPNGSQSWCAGTSQTLTWTSTAVTNVKIELSGDAGSTWSEVVPSTPAAGGSYSWAIPATQAGGSSYRIRVSDASASAVNDASDADFTINAAPAITAQPSDQVVVAGSTATFTASTSATATVQWQSSIDGGASWGDIAGAASTTYSLTAGITGSGTQFRAVFDNGTCTNTTHPATLTVKVSATDLGPAVIFLGVTNNSDNNRDLDLKVDLYRNGVLISSGELTDERVTGTLLNSSRKYTVPLTMTGGSVDFSATDVLSVVVSARRNGGNSDFDAVLWYDASASPSQNHGNKGWSRVGNETEGGTSTGYYYLRSSAALNGSSGSSGTTIQRSLGTTWVEFGTWSMYGAQMKSVTDSPAGDGTLSAVLIPNPSDGDVVTLRLSQGAGQEVSISVVDATGRIVMAERLENTRSQADAGIPINTGNLPSGTYLVIIRSGEESIVRRLTIVR